MEFDMQNKKKYSVGKPKMGWVLAPDSAAMGPVQVMPTALQLPLLGGHPNASRSREGKRNLTATYLYIRQPKSGRMGYDSS